MQEKKSDFLTHAKQGLLVAAQVILSLPLRLPSSVVQVAKVVNIALSLWDQLEQQDKKPEDTAAPLDESGVTL